MRQTVCAYMMVTPDLCMLRSGSRILVVEDEPLISLQIDMELEDIGLDVLHASNCAQALAMIKRHFISAAVLDVNLGGGETSCSVAARLSQENIPFFYHTSEDREVIEALGQFRVPIVPKPAAEGALAWHVSNIIGQQATT